MTCLYENNYPYCDDSLKQVMLYPIVLALKPKISSLICIFKIH